MKAFCTIALIATIAFPLAGKATSLDSLEAPMQAKRSLRSRFADAPTVNVANIEELYSAVNDPLNAGNLIVMSPGIYMLSANDPQNVPRLNGGRLELQQNMSLQGVLNDRAAAVIDAANLPSSSYSGEVTNTGAIRMGKGTNSIEWMTIRNASAGGAGIIAHLSAPGTTNIRIAHIVSTGNARGIDVRNFRGAGNGFVLNADIVDNDLHDNSVGIGTGLRIVNLQGAAGNVVSASLSGNRIFNNFFGTIIENTGSTNSGSITISSSGDRFFDNGLGALVGGGLGFSTGNTVDVTATSTNFENNNGPNNLDRGGLLAVAGENTAIPNGTSNNSVNIVLRGCRLANNQSYDLAAIGARSSPESIGSPGTNNHVTVRLYNTEPAVVVTDDSIPDYPAGMNTVDLIRYFGVSGRVTTPSGSGLRGAAVSIIDPLGIRQTATTSTFGFYSFEAVPAGNGYTISVASRRYRFTPRALDINSNLTDIDLVGLE